MAGKTKSQSTKTAAKNVKRVRGGGTVFQRKDGTWIAKYQHIEYTRGKPITRRAQSEIEALAKLEEIKQQIFGGKLADGTTTDTVKEYMTRWLYNVKRNQLRPQSFDRLESTINTYIFPEFGQFKISTLNTDEIQCYLNDLFDEGKSYSTIKKIYDALNACCKYAIMKGELKKNPVEGVVLRTQAKADRKRQASKIKFYTPEEEALLVQTATSTFKSGKPKYRMGYLIPLLLNTGLRAGELAALQWDKHIDLERRTIFVENTQVLVKNRKYKEGSGDTKYIVKDQQGTKSEAGQRILQVNNTAYNALLELKKIADENGSDYVANTSDGDPLYVQHIDKMFKKICRQAGIPKNKHFGVHSLRHTFASKLFAKGVDVKVVSEILGHSDVQVTYNTYIHVMDVNKKAALYIIDDL